MKNKIIYLLVIVIFSACAKNENQEIMETLFFNEQDIDSSAQNSLYPEKYNSSPPEKYNTVYSYDFTIEDTEIWTAGTYGDGQFTTKYENGKYHIHNNSLSKAHLVGDDFYYLDFNKNYEIEVKIKIGNGSNGNGNGIIFGYDATGSGGMAFGIHDNTSTGGYKVWYYSNYYDRIEQVYKKEQNSNFEQYQDNKLTIRHFDGQFYYFLNETLLYQANIETNYQNRLGFVVSRTDDIYIDDIVIKEQE